MPDPPALALQALGLQTCISTTRLSLESPVCHLFSITFFSFCFRQCSPPGLLSVPSVSRFLCRILFLDVFLHLNDSVRVGEVCKGTCLAGEGPVREYQAGWRFESAFLSLLRLILCFSSASSSSLYRSCNPQTWEATSPASTCKYVMWIWGCHSYFRPHGLHSGHRQDKA